MHLPAPPVGGPVGRVVHVSPRVDAGAVGDVTVAAVGVPVGGDEVGVVRQGGVAVVVGVIAVVARVAVSVGQYGGGAVGKVAVGRVAVAQGGHHGLGLHRD